MKEQIIHLEPHDDVTSVREKLGWVRAPRVLLVFPPKNQNRILHRKLDLVLIQREATRLRAQLALVTKDALIIEHAKELGIACFKSVQEGHQSYWDTTQAQFTIAREEQPQQLEAELAEAATRLRPPPQIIPENLQYLAVRGFLILLGLGLLTGLVVTVPSATIILTPASNQITITTSVIASPDATDPDPLTGVIPARRVGIEVETSTSIQTTGTTEQPTEKARGIALFTNRVADQVTIPAGTIVRTSAAEPVRFITLTDATLPGQVGDTVEVPIEAVEPGYTGNVPVNRVNQIDGVLSNRLVVSNPQPTRGGDVAETQAISQADYDRIRALALQELQQRAYAEMLTNPYINLAESEFIPQESLVVVLVHAETYQGYIGEAAEQLSLTIRVTVQGVAIDERFARQIVYSRLIDKVGSDYELGTETLIFKRGEIIETGDNQEVTFIMQGAGDVAQGVATEEIRNLVRGKTRQNALTALDRELPLTQPPQIETFPRFWPFMPLTPLRITVQISGGS